LKPFAAVSKPPTSSTGRLRTWIKRLLLDIPAAVVLLLIAGVLYQSIATQIDRRIFPPHGQMVDVGGYRLHLNCAGVYSSQQPTVILETGLGGLATSSDWAWVQPEVARTTLVCAYDRAGLGWSDPGPQPRDARHIAAELHTLLQASHTPGPYVLVGWSYGGLYAREYAGQYPQEVAGLVLVDSSSPEQCAFSPAWEAQCASTVKNASRAALLAPFGVLRLVGLFQPPTGLPEPQKQELLASFSSQKDWAAQKAELQATPDTDAQVLAAQTLGSRPVYVLTATDHNAPPELEQQWQAWQSGYTALSTNSAQRVVEGATHNSLVFSPTDSKITAAAILQVVDSVRTGKGLSSP